MYKTLELESNNLVETFVWLVGFLDTESYYVVQTRLEPVLLLHLPPVCWNYRQVPPDLALLKLIEVSFLGKNVLVLYTDRK
jgi:hypothetical protein